MILSFLVKASAILLSRSMCCWCWFSFYATQIYDLCRPRWKWWICTPVVRKQMSILFPSSTDAFLYAGPVHCCAWRWEFSDHVQYSFGHWPFYLSWKCWDQYRNIVGHKSRIGYADCSRTLRTPRCPTIESPTDTVSILLLNYDGGLRTQLSCHNRINRIIDNIIIFCVERFILSM